MSSFRPKYRLRSRSRGFTIIELMIATSVFAVILMVMTMSILQISRVYYKGITTTNTQTTARNIVDTISQAIQFSGGEVTTTSHTGPGTAAQEFVFCVGNQKFSYVVGYQLEEGSPQDSLEQNRHVLVMDNVSGCVGSPARDLDSAAALPPESRELMSPKMRLANLRVDAVSGQPNLYRVTVRVVYGDKDLLVNPTSETARCKSERSGTQFCAISELSTVVTKRVE